MSVSQQDNLKTCGLDTLNREKVSLYMSVKHIYNYMTMMNY